MLLTKANCQSNSNSSQCATNMDAKAFLFFRSRQIDTTENSSKEPLTESIRCLSHAISSIIFDMASYFTVLTLPVAILPTFESTEGKFGGYINWNLRREKFAIRKLACIGVGKIFGKPSKLKI